MPETYTLRDAKARLSEILDLVASGVDVEITRQGEKRGRFRVVSADAGFGARKPGALKGRIKIPDDFDEESPEIIADFEGA